MTAHPLVIASPYEHWFAALTPSKAQAVDALVSVVGFDRNGLAAQLSETRLARVPVPVEHEGEYGEWYEPNPAGDIAAWELWL